MKPDEIQITDIRRILLGETPWSFLIEVGVRAIITYLILLVAARLMGKRVAGQMSVMEITIMVTLGAAIGVPLQAPERGMLPAVIILGIAVLYQRGFNWWSFKSRKAEVLLQGDVGILVRDGCMDLKAMEGSVLSRERLFSVLRQQGLIHLGQAKRVYLEADGHFSVYKNPEPPAGLCLMPEQDVELYEEQFAACEHHACRSCGHVEEGREQPGECKICGATYWSPAVRDVEVKGFKSRDQLKAEEKTRDGAAKEREKNHKRNEHGGERGRDEGRNDRQSDARDDGNRFSPREELSESKRQ